MKKVKTNVAGRKKSNLQQILQKSNKAALRRAGEKLLREYESSGCGHTSNFVNSTL